MPRGLPRGTDRWGIQGGMPPWSQGAGSCPAREGEAGSPDEVRATVGRGNAKRFPLQVDWVPATCFRRCRLLPPQVQALVEACARGSGYRDDVFSTTE